MEWYYIILLLQLEDQLIYLKWFHVLICSLEDLMSLKYTLVFIKKVSEPSQISPLSPYMPLPLPYFHFNLPGTASQGKSHVPSWSETRYLTPFMRHPKVPRHAGFPWGEHRESRHHFLWAPTPLLFATGELIPLRGLEGVPGLHGAPQDEAGLARKFETSPVAGAPCWTTLISRSAVEENPMPGRPPTMPSL